MVLQKQAQLGPAGRPVKGADRGAEGRVAAHAP
jgi:hypothetical protein